jgi:basic membrane protein A
MMFIIIVLLVLVIAVRPLTRQDTASEAKWRPGEPISRERIKIGIIHLTDPLKEKDGYSYAHEAGIREMQRDTGIKDEQIMRKTHVSDANPSEIEYVMRECIAAGANVVIATSWGYMDTCAKLAGEYPGVIFAHASGYKKNDTNFTNYFGRIYEPRYLSGIVAGLRTRTNKIGYVAAMGKDNSEVTGGIDAFAMGVESVNPDAKIYVKVTKSWFDPTEEAIAAFALIAAGCDVIGQHCDTAVPQTEAERAGIWGIGYNSDMSAEAPDAVITSVIWRWGMYYTHLIRSVIDGTFTTEPYSGGIGDGMVDITPINDAIAAPGTMEAVNDVRDRMKRGDVKLFTGEIKTNDGRKIGVAGEPLSDAEIRNNINWYYHNVIEL